jgi:hypothetical protein
MSKWMVKEAESLAILALKAARYRLLFFSFQTFHMNDFLNDFLSFTFKGTYMAQTVIIS